MLEYITKLVTTLQTLYNINTSKRAIIQAMVELLSGIILSKNAPKEEISFSYEKGTLNYISYEERYKFNFLMIKNESLDKGTFKINDVQIYPEESNESSLFFLPRWIASP